MSPGLDKRGRQVRFWRGTHKMRSSFWFFAAAPVKEVVEFCVDCGILPKCEEPSCQKCSSKGRASSMTLTDIHPGILGWRCRCGDRTSLLKAITEQTDVFPWLPKVPLRKQLGVVWLLTRRRSIQDICEIASISEDSVCTLQRMFVDIVSRHQEAENVATEIGGEFQQYEADECCFRCIAGTDHRGGPVVWWLRYIEIMKRGNRRFIRGVPVEMSDLDIPVGGCKNPSRSHAGNPSPLDIC